MSCADILTRIDDAAAQRQGVVLSPSEVADLEWFMFSHDLMDKAKVDDEVDYFNNAVEYGTRGCF